MGFFDELKEKFLTTTGRFLDENKPLTDAITELINTNGGLANLVKNIQNRGFGDVMASSLTVKQVQAVLGQEKIKPLAKKLGMTPEQMAQQLTIWLPVLIAQLATHTKDQRAVQSREPRDHRPSAKQRTGRRVKKTGP
jgi:hypothetical protein